MKGFIVKDGKKIQIMLEEGNRPRFTAFDAETLNQIGYLNFAIKGGKDAYLSAIKVEDSNFLRCGVGAVMLNCFETYCMQHRTFRIDGRFFPTGEGGAFAREFYENNGYEIYRADYEQYIMKHLPYANIDERYVVESLEEEQMDENYEDVYTDLKLQQALSQPEKPDFISANEEFAQ